MLFLIHSLSYALHNQMEIAILSLTFTLKKSKQIQMWKSSICCLQFIRLQNFCLLQRALTEQTLTDAELVNLPNTPTGHGQKKEVCSTLNCMLLLIILPAF